MYSIYSSCEYFEYIYIHIYICIYIYINIYIHMPNFGHCFVVQGKVLYTMNTFFDLVSRNSLIQVNMLDLNTFVTYDLHYPLMFKNDGSKMIYLK